MANILKKTDSQFKAYWAKALFSGKATPPKEVDNDEQMIDLISNNPNMIGFIKSSSTSDNVKVIYKF